MVSSRVAFISAELPLRYIAFLLVLGFISVEFRGEAHSDFLWSLNSHEQSFGFSWARTCTLGSGYLVGSEGQGHVVERRFGFLREIGFTSAEFR